MDTTLSISKGPTDIVRAMLATGTRLVYVATLGGDYNPVRNEIVCGDSYILFLVPSATPTSWETLSAF